MDELVVIGSRGDVSVVGDGIERVDGKVFGRGFVEEHFGLPRKGERMRRRRTRRGRT